MRLAGRVILWTRPVDGEDALAAALEREGAVLVAAPVVRFTAPADGRALADALAAVTAGAYAGVLLTSPRAVDAVAGRVPAGTPVAVLGGGTRTRARTAGFTRFINAEDTADGASLAGLLVTGGNVRGARYLLPTSQVSRADAAEALRAHGAAVDVVEAYRTQPAPALPHAAMAALAAGTVEGVVCMSPSAVDALCALVSTEILGRLVRAAPGRTTAQAWAHHGLPAQAIAEKPDADGLTRALAAALASRRVGK
ncbi:MAG: uroporphyrinogen-III synthase [Deltaproteobacteria bacterium]|nr:uroporphyrinogen-III synthase [Deltaproteobacteria bacterium]